MGETDPHRCQFYLVTPPRLGESFPQTLGRLMGQFDIAAVRLALDTHDVEVIAEAADRLRPICHEHDRPLLIAEHFRLVSKLGLDGAHLTDLRNLREARDTMPQAASLGVFCGTSRHAGLSAGEMGADYVSFGPLGQTDLGAGETVAPDTLNWWHDMIEIPCVGEGALTPELAGTYQGWCDFLALGPEIWSAGQTPEAAMAEFAARITQAAP